MIQQRKKHREFTRIQLLKNSVARAVIITAMSTLPSISMESHKLSEYEKIMSASIPEGLTAEEYRQKGTQLIYDRGSSEGYRYLFEAIRLDPQGSLKSYGYICRHFISRYDFDIALSYLNLGIEAGHPEEKFKNCYMLMGEQALLAKNIDVATYSYSKLFGTSEEDVRSVISLTYPTFLVTYDDPERPYLPFLREMLLLSPEDREDMNKILVNWAAKASTNHWNIDNCELYNLVKCLKDAPKEDWKNLYGSAIFLDQPQIRYSQIIPILKSIPKADKNRLIFCLRAKKLFDKNPILQKHRDTTHYPDYLKALSLLDVEALDDTNFKRIEIMFTDYTYLQYLEEFGREDMQFRYSFSHPEYFQALPLSNGEAIQDHHLEAFDVSKITSINCFTLSFDKGSRILRWKFLETLASFKKSLDHALSVPYPLFCEADVAERLLTTPYDQWSLCIQGLINMKRNEEDRQSHQLLNRHLWTEIQEFMRKREIPPTQRKDFDLLAYNMLIDHFRWMPTKYQEAYLEKYLSDGLLYIRADLQKKFLQEKYNGKRRNKAQSFNETSDNIYDLAQVIRRLPVSTQDLVFDRLMGHLVDHPAHLFHAMACISADDIVDFMNILDKRIHISEDDMIKIDMIMSGERLLVYSFDQDEELRQRTFTYWMDLLEKSEEDESLLSRIANTIVMNHQEFGIKKSSRLYRLAHKM